MGDPEKWVKDTLDSGKRLMGFGHRIYRAETRARGSSRRQRASSVARRSRSLSASRRSPSRARAASPRAAPADERRVLLGARPRHRAGAAAARARDVRLLPGREGGRRTSWSRSAPGRLLPFRPVPPSRRPAAANVVPGVTLAEAAAQAAEFAEQGKERRALRAAPTVGGRGRGRRPQSGLPRARGSPTGRSASSAGGRRTSCWSAGSRTTARLPRLSARLDRAALARPSPARQHAPGCVLHHLLNAGRERCGPAAGGGRLSHGSPERQTIVLLEHLAQDDEQPAELRPWPKQVAQTLEAERALALSRSARARPGGRTRGTRAAPPTEQALRHAASPSAQPAAVTIANTQASCGSNRFILALVVAAALIGKPSGGARGGGPRSTPPSAGGRSRACTARSSRGRRGPAAPGRLRRSAPPSSMWVANEWRSRWGWIRSGSSPAFPARRRRITEGARTGERPALRVQEDLRPVALVQVRPPAREVAPERLDGLAPDRDDPLLRALAEGPHDAVVEVDGATLEAHRLDTRSPAPYSSSTSARSRRSRGATRGRLDEPLGLGGRQRPREAAGAARRGERGGRVLGHALHQLEVAVEACG